MKNFALLLIVASIGWAGEAPAAFVWMSGSDYTQFIFRIEVPTIDKPCPEVVKDALAKDQLFITSCGPQTDYSKVLAPEARWTFHIDGKDYTLTGTQLIEAIKAVRPETAPGLIPQTSVEAKPSSATPSEPKAKSAP